MQLLNALFKSVFFVTTYLLDTILIHCHILYWKCTVKLKDCKINVENSIGQLQIFHKTYLHIIPTYKIKSKV